MNKHNNKNGSLQNAIDQYTDSYNCNLKEKAMIECYNKLDNSYFFKKRKFKKCLELENEFRHCLVFSNEISLNKRTNYQVERTNNEIINKNKDIILENKKDAIDFMKGAKTEEEILNKINNFKKKKIVEL